MGAGESGLDRTGTRALVADGSTASVDGRASEERYVKATLSGAFH